MEENFIQLKKDNILRIGIKDSDGNPTGEKLEFDLEDIELVLKAQQCDELHKQNVIEYRNQIKILEKKQDKKGKKLLSWKQEEQIKLLSIYYQKEIEALDLFIGKGGTMKLLNGRKPYFTMFNDFSEILQPIMPLIKQRSEDVKDKIKKLYSANINIENNGDVLENE